MLLSSTLIIVLCDNIIIFSMVHFTLFFVIGSLAKISHMFHYCESNQMI